MRTDIWEENFLGSRLRLTENARKAKGSNISEIINNLEYNYKELLEGLNIYIDLIKKIEANNNKGNKICFYDGNRETEAKVIKYNIVRLYKGLEENKNDIAVDDDPDSRRRQYKSILSGLRVIAEILYEKDIDLESLAGNLSTIANLEKVCTAGKARGVRELIITYQEDVQKRLGTETNSELNKIKQRLNGICERSIKKVVDKIRDAEDPHEQLVFYDYLSEYGYFDLPKVVDFNDELNRKDTLFYRQKVDKIRERLRNNSLEDMIIEDILKTYENVLNGKQKESLEAKYELVDYWVDLYRGKEEKKELDDWAKAIIEEYKKDITKKDEILQVIKSEKKYDGIIEIIERDIRECNSKFLSEYVEIYKNTGRLIVEDIVGDREYLTRQYFSVYESEIKEKVENILNDCDKNEYVRVNDIKELVISIIRSKIKELKLKYNAAFLEKYVYNDEYDVKKIVIEEILKDTGYLKETYYDREENKIAYEKTLIQSIGRALNYCERETDKEDLLSRVKDIIKEDKYLFANLLVKAAERDNIDSMKFLMKIDMEIPTSKKDLLLRKLVEMGDKATENIKYLVERGAEVKWPILTEAVVGGNENVLKYLFEHSSSGRSSLELWLLFNLAASRKNENIVEYLVKQGANVDKGILGFTPLISAIVNGNENIVRCLVKQGADVNRNSIFFTSPLYTAVCSEDKYIVEYLIEQGADMNKRTMFGRTMLELAIRENKEKIVQILVKQGADVNKRTIFGKTMLELAKKMNNPRIVKILEKSIEISIDKDQEDVIDVSIIEQKDGQDKDKKISKEALEGGEAINEDIKIECVNVKGKGNSREF